MAHNSLLRLLLGFLAIVAAVSGATAIAYWLTSPGHSFWFWWRQAFLILGTEPTAPGVNVASTQFHAALQAFLTVMSLTLPALVLGVIVFKAFVAPNVFTTRKSIALVKNDTVPRDVADQLLAHDSHHYSLALRMYSSTKMELMEVEFYLYARIRGRSAAGVPVVSNYKLELAKDRWPIALTHVPYTLYVPLLADDVYVHPDSSTTKLVALQGHGIADKCRLLLHISGSIPALNSQFVEAHWYLADADISTEPFGEVHVDYEPQSKSKQWEGWPKFDEA